MAKSGVGRPVSHQRYVLGLAAAFAAIWAVLAIAPVSRETWLLENMLVALLVLALVVSWRRFVFSPVSMTLIFLFLCLHEVGSHYTYSEVPLDRWMEQLTGRTLTEMTGWQRNHFDRLVHFCYGLMLAYPIREIFLRVVKVRGFWGYFLPWDVTMSTSLMYELIEWGAAEFFGGDLGMAYLGTQGDVWDAHKDMALAGLGATIAMTVTAVINSYTQRDFSREWAESLQVRPDPPDEADAGGAPAQEFRKP